MCSACGYPARPGHWTDAGLSTPHDRLRARFQRAAMLRVALAPYGLTAHDDGVTDGITLSTLSGAHVIVPNLDDLWHHAAILAGRPIDPLA
jgi:hypothetical protein